MKHLIACCLFALPGVALGTDPNVGEEIDALIAHLRSSPCEFNRNGKWYSAAAAAKHLRRKYAYLEGRQLAPDAETFIERAASASSASGKPYLVKCEGQEQIESGDWFVQVLKSLRSGG